MLIQNFFDSEHNITDLKGDIHIINDVWVDPYNGCIFLEDGSLDSYLNYEALFWIKKPYLTKRGHDKCSLSHQILQRTKFLEEDHKKHRNNLEPIIVKKGIYFLHPFGWYPYGHLYDTLQRAYSLFLNGTDIRDYLILTSDSDRVVCFHEHLSIALGKRHPYISFKRNDAPFFVEKLLVPINHAVVTNFTEGSLKYFQKNFEKYFKNSKKPKTKILYLSRNEVRKGTRGVLNEKVVINELSQHDTTILLGNENLATIYSLFSNADLIVGAHGAMFVNTFLCKENCHIVEFCADNRINFNFQNQLKSTKHYHHLISKADEKQNITINIEYIRALIKKLQRYE